LSCAKNSRSEDRPEEAEELILCFFVCFLLSRNDRGDVMNKFALLGLGLIGGSLGLALQHAGVAEHIYGYDNNQDATYQAWKIGAITEIHNSAEEAVQEAEIVILSAPIHAIPGLLERIAPHLKQGVLVSDTASTKVQILNWARKFLPAHATFVGGHPMAGRELSGIQAAEAGLFNDCTYCLIPGEQSSTEGIAQLGEIVVQLGAHPLVLDAVRHDHLVAGVSHLPFMLSSALVHCLSRQENWNELTTLAAGGFRDMSRLAAGSPTMYRDICATNKGEIVHWLDALVSELGNIRSLLAGNDEVLEHYFETAKQSRETAIR
jgi:prephenate dehydrogenase